jgi:hypothetical protein
MESEMTVYTLDNLPEYGQFNVFITATRINFDESEDGNAENGWVDYPHSTTELWDNRNYVRPYISIPTREVRSGEEYGADYILGEIAYVLGYVDSSDDGTIYAADAQTWDYRSADAFQYAMHAHVKHLTDAGYVESPVHIPADLINGK